MLRWAIFFLVVAVVAGLAGLTGVADFSMDTAWIIFLGFIILLVVSLILGRRRPTV